MSGNDPLNTFVLHTRRYGDSSLITDLFTREQGRLAAVAKGALRARVERIQPFQAYVAELRGRGEVLTLAKVEASAQPLALKGRTLYCGLYLNELLLKLTARQDACAALFDDYAAALSALNVDPDVEPILRRFEVRLLNHLGMGLILDSDVNGQSIESDQRYTYDVGQGPLPASRSVDSVSGATLIALREDAALTADTIPEARRLMRQVLNHHLDGRPLRSRELFR